MVYIKSWTEYQAQAEKLYEEQPTRTRYCVKYRARDGGLTLKVTDDNRCLKYKTQSSIMLNRFEAFNLSMMSKMQNRRPQPPPALVATTSAGVGQAHPVGQDVAMADASATQGTGGTAPGAGAAAQAGKKKKPKKKK